MPIDYNTLMSRDFDNILQEYKAKDVMLYALAVGLGQDPTDEEALRFVYEDGLKVMPSMANVLAYPGFWAKESDTGIDWVNLLHVGQELILHKEFPVEASVEAKTKIKDIIDKGVGKGAIIISERLIRNAKTGDDLCTVRMTSLARGDGGFSGRVNSTKLAHDPMPSRAPDSSCLLPTMKESALLYRLCGDYNPLHASPSIARAAGFEAPILHGLCTFGVATHAILRTQCNYQADRLSSIRMRFTAPVYPGDQIETKLWRDKDIVRFKCEVPERSVTIINNGFAEIK